METSQRIIELEAKLASLSECFDQLNKKLIDITYKNSLYENMIGDLRFRIDILERSTNEMKGQIEPPQEEEPKEVPIPYPTAYEKHENRRIPPRFIPNKGHNQNQERRQPPQERRQPPQERRQPPQERRQHFQEVEQDNGNRQQRPYRKDFQRRDFNRIPKKMEQEKAEQMKNEEEETQQDA